MALNMDTKWITACVLACLATACSDAAAPPFITDSDGGVPNDDGGAVTTPCATPAAGCPCNESDAKVYCGIIYRYSGKHVDCSPGYLTCQDNGTWSACVGPSVYDGG